MKPCLRWYFMNEVIDFVIEIASLASRFIYSLSQCVMTHVRIRSKSACAN